MRQPTKGVLALTMMLMLLAASSQAAVCELSCALKMQSGACHMAAGAPMADTAAMDMSVSHCPMRGFLFESAAPHGSCKIPLVFAVEKRADVENVALAPGRTVVEAWLVRAAPAVSERMAGTSPPFRLAAIDPLFLSFRV